MKFVLNSLKKGDQIVAEIVELVDEQEFIASFQGDLIRVANKSNRTFAPGQKVTLQVIAISPLAFQLMALPKFKSRISVQV